MALKITSEIGTDQGITSEAYVRIVNYNINKGGNANFALQLFNSETEAANLSNASGPVTPVNGIAKNVSIGEILYVPLTKEVSETTTVLKPVPTEVEVTEEVQVPGEEGTEPVSQTVTKKVVQVIMTEVEETTVKTVPDLTPLEGVDIFTFAYGKLKIKLEGLFGEGNVVDC